MGTLRPGAYADIALFAVDEGSFPLYDFSHELRHVQRLLRNTTTIVDGRVLPPMVPEPPAPWLEFTEAQWAYQWSREAALAEPHHRHINRPEHFDEPTPVERESEPLPREK